MGKILPKGQATSTMRNPQWNHCFPFPHGDSAPGQRCGHSCGRGPSQNPCRPTTALTLAGRRWPVTPKPKTCPLPSWARPSRSHRDALRGGARPPRHRGNRTERRTVHAARRNRRPGARWSTCSREASPNAAFEAGPSRRARAPALQAGGYQRHQVSERGHCQPRPVAPLSHSGRRGKNTRSVPGETG